MSRAYRVFLGSMLLGALACGACGAVERSAANDPMKCERDPKCNAHRDKSNDCATACSDNIECMDRCRQVTGQR